MTPNGTTFSVGRNTYEVTTHVPSRPKFPYTAKRLPDGKLFKFPANIVEGTPTGTKPYVEAVIPVKTNDLVGEQARWNTYAARFGLPRDLVGTTLTSKGTEFRITSINPSRPKFPISASRVRDGAPFKFTTAAVAAKTKRSEQSVLADIRRTYSDLSPENLHWDGERSQAEAQRAARALNTKLLALFTEIGRVVPESEACR